MIHKSKLTPIKQIGRDKHHNAIWLYMCDCGNTKAVRKNDVVRNRIKSCGCLLHLQGKHAKRTTHGESAPRTKEYTAWRGMMNRCYQPNHSYYHDYGGRGISVCERWRHNYPAFLEDVGRAPSPQHSIDRIDNDGNYEPANVRWATNNQQGLNRRPKRIAKDNKPKKTHKSIKRAMQVTGILMFLLSLVGQLD
jgi:hypothetical protein